MICKGKKKKKGKGNGSQIGLRYWRVVEGVGVSPPSSVPPSPLPLFLLLHRVFLHFWAEEDGGRGMFRFLFLLFVLSLEFPNHDDVV